MTICISHDFELSPYMSDKTSELHDVCKNGHAKLENKLVMKRFLRIKLKRMMDMMNLVKRIQFIILK